MSPHSRVLFVAAVISVAVTQSNGSVGPPTTEAELRTLFSAIERDLCDPSMQVAARWAWKSVTHRVAKTEVRDGRRALVDFREPRTPWEGDGLLDLKSVGHAWRVDVTVGIASPAFVNAYKGVMVAGGSVFGTPDGQIALATNGSGVVSRSRKHDQHWDLPLLSPNWVHLFREQLEYPWPSARLVPAVQEHYVFPPPELEQVSDDHTKVVLRMRIMGQGQRLLSETRRELLLDRASGYRPVLIEQFGKDILTNRTVLRWVNQEGAWLPSHVESQSFVRAVDRKEVLANQTWTLSLVPGSLIRGRNVVTLEDVQPSPEIVAAILGPAQRDSSGRSGTGQTLMERVSENRWYLIFTVSVLCVALLLVVRMAMTKRARLMHTK